MSLVNQDMDGNPTVRFDVDGNAIDAHDGQIQRFGDTYFLYGTAYGCGFEWNTDTAPFCGFVSYSSPDLVHWTPNGPLFDATTEQWQARCDGGTYGCFRPKVVFNEATGRYVLWINSYDNAVDYHVFTSESPDGGFVEVAQPDLGVPEGSLTGTNYGDHSIFVDGDGTAYLSFTDWISNGDIIVEKLDPTYTTGTGEWSRVNLQSTEAPTIFTRDGTYYLTYSDPNRGYATTGTSYVTATNPLGPWTGVEAGPWSLVDGALAIHGGGVGLSKAGAAWTDYTFSAAITPLEADRGGYAQTGLVFRSSTLGSYQWLIGNYPFPGKTGGNLTKLVPGKQAETVRLPFDIVSGQTYAVAITAVGGTIETRIDGVLVDTTVDSTLPSGRVGFRESGGGDGERTLVGGVTVTSPGGATLLEDDFGGSLVQWEPPVTGLIGTKLTTTSCGGQPTDVLTLPTSAGTLYLYQSDVWMNGKPNEALAKQYWAPLGFDDDGAILPISCEPSTQVTIPTGSPTTSPSPADISAGDLGFQTFADIAAGISRAQSFTATRSMTAESIRFATFRDGYPDAPLELQLRPVDEDGAIGDEVLVSRTIDPTALSWAPRWNDLLTQGATVDLVAGKEYAIVARSESAAGRYGMLYSDTTPLEGGSAYYTDSSSTPLTVEDERVLRFDVTAVASPAQPEPSAGDGPSIEGAAPTTGAVDTASAGSSRAELAQTGAASFGWAASAAGFVLGGAGILMMRRRGRCAG